MSVASHNGGEKCILSTPTPLELTTIPYNVGQNLVSIIHSNWNDLLARFLEL